MTAKVMFAALIIHLGTAFGVIAAGIETAGCAGSDNYLCGTPLAGLFDKNVSISANPFKVSGSILTIMRSMGELTWYNYAALNESDNNLVQLYTWVVRAVFTSLSLYLLYRTAGTVANAVGRFFGR